MEISVKENKSSLDGFKLQYEDPHPKHVGVNLTKRNRFVGRVSGKIKSFFYNIQLAIKELIDTIM